MGIETSAELDQLVDPNIFGDSALYNGTTTINVVLEFDSDDPADEFDVETENRQITIEAKLSDVPALAEGDTFLISGVTYYKKGTVITQKDMLIIPVSLIQ